MKPVALTASTVITFLEEAVAAKGADYVYDKGRLDMCTYQRAGVPSCLVGAVLHRAGYSIAALRRFDKADSGTSVEELSQAGLLALPDDVVRILSTAQSAQDCGQPWGEALEFAKRRAALTPA